jgi:DUF971 family protein
MPSSSPTARRPPRLDRARPIEIVADRPQGVLRVLWADRHESTYPFPVLRWNCPCAECAGEAGLPGRLQQVDHLEPAETTLRSVEAVGLYGIRPTWGDGHDTGIFGLELLRRLCPCPVCREEAKRAHSRPPA